MESGNRFSDDASPSLCVTGCGFYANPEKQNRCSYCFEKFLKQQAIPEAVSSINRKPTRDHRDVILKEEEEQPSVRKEEEQQPAVRKEEEEQPSAREEEEQQPAVRKEEEEQPRKKKKRCEACNRKVGLLGFDCRCGKVFCGSHRYPREHSCTFDFKELDRRVLVENNPLVVADKLDVRI